MSERTRIKSSFVISGDPTSEAVAQNLRQRADKMDALHRTHEAAWFRKGADEIENLTALLEQSSKGVTLNFYEKQVVLEAISHELDTGGPYPLRKQALFKLMDKLCNEPALTKESPPIDFSDTGDKWRCVKCGQPSSMYGHVDSGCPPTKNGYT